MAATFLSLFSGVGMLDEGFRAAVQYATGEPAVCVGHCEWEAYAAAVLLARMEDAPLERAPVWCGDIRDLDGRDLRGRVDWLVGGFPCQDISSAGKGEGIKEGNRSGLWFEYARLLGEIRPAGAFIENVSALRLPGRGFEHVLSELAALGYDAEWLHLRAADVGAPHQRDRVFILAYDPGQQGRLFPRPRRPRQPAADAGGDVVGLANARDGQLQKPRRGPGGRNGPGPASEGGSMADAAVRRGGRPGQHTHAGDRRQNTGPESPELAHPARGGLGVSGQPPEGDGQPDGCDEGLGHAGGFRQSGGDAPVRSGAGQRLRAETAGPGERDAVVNAERAQPGAGDASEQAEARQRRRGPADADTRLGDAAGGGVEGVGAGGQQEPPAPTRPALPGRAGDQLPPFPPGPADRDAWRAVLEQCPHLAPALEPGVRVLADGLALVLDAGRADQLRCAGNGVVAHQAAVALVLLARRAGLVE